MQQSGPGSSMHQFPHKYLKAQDAIEKAFFKSTYSPCIVAAIPPKYSRASAAELTSTARDSEIGFPTSCVSNKATFSNRILIHGLFLIKPGHALLLFYYARYERLFQMN